MHVLAVVGFSQDTALTSVPSGHRESLMQRLGRLASPGPLLVRSPTVLQDFPIIISNGKASLTVNPRTLVGGHSYGAHLLVEVRGNHIQSKTLCFHLNNRRRGFDSARRCALYALRFRTSCMPRQEIQPSRVCWRGGTGSLGVSC